MGASSAVFLRIGTMMFLSAKPASPALRSLPFLWVRNGAVISLLAIAALVVLPPTPAVAFWSVASNSSWLSETNSFAKNAEIFFSDGGSSTDQYYFKNRLSKIKYDALYKETELSASPEDKYMLSEYDNSSDTFNHPLKESFTSNSRADEFDVASLDSTLARSGSYKGVAYRGAETTNEYVDGLEIDGLYTETTFSSATVDFRTSAAYAYTNTTLKKNLQRIIYRRYLKSGRVIADFEEGALPGDQELVSRPNTVFKVRGIAKIKSEKYGEVTLVVEEEVEEGGLIKTNDENLLKTKLYFSGKNYRPSRGLLKSSQAYKDTYNEDGTGKAGSGGCTRP